MKCPNCNSEIPKENINIQTDLAHCFSCDSIISISEVMNGTPFDEDFDIDSPPSGAWIRRERSQLVIGATTRSAVAFFIVPFMLVWSGGSIGGIYGSQLISGEFNLFMSLFGIPFLLGSVIFWSFALMTIAGKVELTLTRDGGKVFTGVGSIGLTKKFTWDEVSSITEGVSNVKYPGKQNGNLQLEGQKRISFGSGLKTDRQYYILKAMKVILVKLKQKRNFI